MIAATLLAAKLLYSFVSLPSYQIDALISSLPTQAGTDGVQGAWALAEDGSDVMVSDVADGHVYVLSGGAGSPLGASVAGLAGLVRTRAGRLFAASLDSGDLVELSPLSGAVIQSFTVNIPCPSQMAQDLAGQSDDLLVSSSCSNAVYKVSISGNLATAALFSSAVSGPDGLAVGADAKVYVAGLDGVSVLKGTQDVAAGSLDRLVALSPAPNGVAVLPGAAGLQPYVYVSRSNGIFSRLDLNADPAAVLDVFEGGGRGAGVLLDSQGRLLLAQGGQVLRISASGGGGLGGPQPTPTPSAPTETPTETVTPYAAPSVTPDLMAEDILHEPQDSFFGLEWQALAADQGGLYGVRPCQGAKVYRRSMDGLVSVAAELLGSTLTCPAMSLALSLGQGGFENGILYVSVQDTIYRMEPGSSLLQPFMRLPIYADSGIALAFDAEGAFGHDLLAVSSAPARLWRINAGGTAQQVADLPSGAGAAAVAPASWGALAGAALIPVSGGSARWVRSDGSQGFLSGADGQRQLAFVPRQACAWELSGDGLLAAQSAPLTGLRRLALEALQGQADRLACLGADGSVSLADPSGSGVQRHEFGPAESAFNAMALVQCSGGTPDGAWILGPQAVHVGGSLAPRIHVKGASAWTLGWNDYGNHLQPIDSGAADINGATATYNTSGLVDSSFYPVILQATLPGGDVTRTGYFSYGRYFYAGQGKIPGASASQRRAAQGPDGWLYVAKADELQVLDTAGAVRQTLTWPSGVVGGLIVQGDDLWVGWHQGLSDNGWVRRYHRSNGLLTLAAEKTLPTPWSFDRLDDELYVSVASESRVAILDAASLAERRSLTGPGLAVPRELAVDPLRRELWMVNWPDLEAVDIHNGQILRRAVGEGTYDPRLYYDVPRHLLQAVGNGITSYDPVSAQALGTVSGNPYFYACGPGVDGRLLCSDSYYPQLHDVEPLFHGAEVELRSPHFGLVGSASVPVLASVQAPEDGYAWTLYQSLPGGSESSLDNGTGDVADGDQIHSLSVSGLADGIYQLRLEVSKPGRPSFSGSAYFSKGPFRLLSRTSINDMNGIPRVAAGPGESWYVADGIHLRRFEYGEQVQDWTLPAGYKTGLAVDGTEIYLGSSDAGTGRWVRHYSVASGALVQVDSLDLGSDAPGDLILDGSVLYVAQASQHRVLKLAVSGLGILDSLGDASSMSNLSHIALDAAQQVLWFSNDDKLRFLDLATDSVSGEIGVGAAPDAMVFDQGRRLLLAIGVGQMRAYDGDTHAIAASIDVGNTTLFYFHPAMTIDSQRRLVAVSDYAPLMSFDVNVVAAGVTPSPAYTRTATPSPSRTPTFTDSPTLSPSGTLTGTPSFTFSETPTVTLTQTPSPTVTRTITQTRTVTETRTISPSVTGTVTPTETETATPTESGTVTPTMTGSGTPSETGTETPSETETGTQSVTVTGTLSATETATATQSPAETPTGTSTVTATASPSATPTATASASPTATGSATPTASPSATGSATPTATETPSATASPTVTSTSTETESWTVSPTYTASSSATGTPSPSPTPTFTPRISDWSQDTLDEFTWDGRGDGHVDITSGGIRLQKLATGVGDFTTQSAWDLPHPEASVMAWSDEEALYIVQWDGSSDYSQAYSAKFNASGGLDPWQAQTRVPAALGGAGVAVWKDWVYLGGGTAPGPMATRKVYRARMLPDGGLTGWTEEPGLMPGYDYYPRLAAVQGKLYVLRQYYYGGQAGLWSASILPDGSLAPWDTTNPPSMELAVQQAALSVLGNRILMTGGLSWSGTESRVQSAAVQEDGSLAAWSTEAYMPMGIRYQGIVESDSHGCIYIVGGLNEGRHVLRAPLNGAGLPGSGWAGWAPHSWVLPVAMSYSSVVPAKGKLWNLGGANSGVLSSVYASTLALGSANAAKGHYEGQFDLGVPQFVGQLNWTTDLPGSVKGQVRWAGSDMVFSAWSPKLPSPLPIGATVRYIQYKLELSDPGSGTDLLVSAVSLGATVPTSTPTQTPSATSTVTLTATPTATLTATESPSMTASPTWTMTPSATATATATNSPTSTPTDSPTASPTATASATPSATQTASPTHTVTPTDTSTATATPTDSPSPTVTETSTETPSSTATPTDSPSPTVTETSTETPSSTATTTDSPSPTMTPTGTPSPSPTPTFTPRISDWSQDTLDEFSWDGRGDGHVDITSGGIRLQKLATGLGTFVTPTGDNSSLPVASGGLMAWSNEEAVYTLQWDGSSGYTQAYSALFNGNTGLQAWQTLTSVGVAFRSGGVAVWRDWVYVAGGTTSSNTAMTKVYRARMLPGGGLTAWSEAATYPGGGYDYWPRLVASQGKLYVLRAYAWGAQNGVWSSVINADGSLAGLVTDAPMELAVQGSGVASLGNRILVAGGISWSGAETRVQSVEIGENGDLAGPWSTEAYMPLGNAGQRGIETDSHGCLFIVGAYNEGMHVLRGPLNADGLPGSGWSGWTSHGWVLPTSSNSGVVIPRGDRLWYLGSAGTTSISLSPLTLGTANAAKGFYWGRFDLGTEQFVGQLNWTTSLPDSVKGQVRWAGDDGVYGAWSPRLPSPLPIGQTVRYIEYSLELSDPGSGTDLLVSAVSLGATVPTFTPSSTYTATPSMTATATGTGTSTASPSLTASPTATATESPVMTATYSSTESPTWTGTPSASPLATASPTQTASQTLTLTLLATATPTPGGAGFAYYRVNVGGAAYTGVDGAQWSADQAYGSPGFGCINCSELETVTSNPIAGTEDDELYHRGRWNSPSYRFDLANGTYRVRFHWAETFYTASGQRQFNVIAEGAEIYHHLDVFAQTGGMNTALVLDAEVAVGDGELDLSFQHYSGSPIIEAIEVLPSESGPGIAMLRRQVAKALRPRSPMVVAPNPVRGRAVASFVPEQSGIFDLQIFDLTGKLVGESSLAAEGGSRQDMEIPNRQLSSGVYFAVLVSRFVDASRRVETFKFAVVR